MRVITNAHVSERASAGFDHFIAQAVKGSMAGSGGSFSVEASDEPAPAGRAPADVVMLTISSYMFRVVLLMHCERSAAMRSHLAALAHVDTSAIDDARFADELLEHGNLCCGALNRDLAQHFPHIGMSTPCVLERGSVDHLSAVHPTLLRHYRAELADGVGMGLSLAVCAFEDLDFPFEPGSAEAEEDTAGELELF